jgi:hypothetical protein
MGRDECNDEFRPSSKKWESEDEAYAELSTLRKQYEEARSMWVEMLKDKSYYLDLHRDYDDYPADYY